jgi:probable F420-dependent oxidoreductase
MMVDLGLVFPQVEFGSDPEAIKEYAQMAEALGFRYVLCYEHVLGGNPQRPGGLNGPYTYESMFQEPFVLFGFMAGVTRTLEFTTGILVLPQRQTALVAKQAATLDVLSGGRLRLGAAIGWNALEYQALGEEYSTRGKRLEEQVEVLRLLWTQPLVTFHGRWHHLEDVGINPLPVQRPIPIWLGGHADAVLRRAAKLGDGWMPNYRTAEEAQPSLDKLEEYLSANGRQRSDLGLEARIAYGEGNPDQWIRLIEGWHEVGVTHISFNTMNSGLQGAKEHLHAVQKIAKVVL